MRAAICIAMSVTLFCIVPAQADDGDDADFLRTHAQLQRDIASHMRTEKRLLFEKELMQTAEIVAVGEVVNEPASWMKARTRWGTTSWRNSQRFEVVLEVTEYLIGDCGDTLRFWQQRLPSNWIAVPTPEIVTYMAQYVQGDTMIVMLYGDCEEVDTARYSGRSYNWLLSGGSAVGRDTSMSGFIHDLEAAREAEPLHYDPIASPN